MKLSSLDASKEVMRRLNQRREHPNEVPGIPWGLPTLDKMSGGILPGEFTLIGADSNAGKSLFLGQIVLTSAKWLKQNAPGKVVRAIHNEMAARAFQQRLIVTISGVDDKKIRSGYLTKAEYAAVSQAAHMLSELPIEYLVDSRSLQQTTDFILEGNNCALWCVDHMQVHPLGYGSYDSQDARGVGKLAEEFQRLAASSDIPGIALTQLTNEVAKREDHRPTKGDIFGGKMAQANCSNILLLFPPSMYTEKPEYSGHRDPTPVYVTMDKSREGDLGTVKTIRDPVKGTLDEAA